VNAEELAAAADFLTAISEVLDGVKLESYGDMDRWQNSIDRLALAQVRLRAMASDLIIAVDYPQLPDVPLDDLRRYTAFVRDRLAEIQAEAPQPKAPGQPSHPPECLLVGEPAGHEDENGGEGTS
jgi:hypothetical protein